VLNELRQPPSRKENGGPKHGFSLSDGVHVYGG
jgi:hypothetical protein